MHCKITYFPLSKVRIIFINCNLRGFNRRINVLIVIINGRSPKTIGKNHNLIGKNVTIRRKSKLSFKFRRRSEGWCNFYNII